MEIKCARCIELSEKNNQWYCKKLKVILENGYAMERHSKFCGDVIKK
jgi:hypothetical protein